MFLPTPLPALASIDAMRPVFLIVMGLALLLVAWRLTRHDSGWPARLIMAGALLLAFGYSAVLPLYEARVLLPLDLLAYFPDRDAGSVMGWHLTKVFAMNGGWLLFGLGLALKARVFEVLATSNQPAR